MGKKFSESEISRQLVKLALISGALVSAYLAPRDWAIFLPNFVIFWTPHVLLLGMLWAMRSSWTLIAGSATAAAIYLALFGTWVFSARHPEGLAWLGYFFSFPGALLGAITAHYLERHKLVSSVSKPFVVGLVCVAIGITLNQLAVCSTVMFCGFGAHI